MHSKNKISWRRYWALASNGRCQCQHCKANTWLSVTCGRFCALSPAHVCKLFGRLRCKWFSLLMKLFGHLFNELTSCIWITAFTERSLIQFGKELTRRTHYLLRGLLLYKKVTKYHNDLLRKKILLFCLFCFILHSFSILSEIVKEKS